MKPFTTLAIVILATISPGIGFGQTNSADHNQSNQATPPVTAANLNTVTYVDPATDQTVAIRKAGAKWTENSPNGPFTFVEVKRDQASVYLYDEDRGMAMTLDLNANQIIYGSANAAKLIGQEFGSYPIAASDAGFAVKPEDKPLTTRSVVKLKNKATGKWLGVWDRREYVMVQNSGTNWKLGRTEETNLTDELVVHITHSTQGGYLYLYGNDWLAWEATDLGAIARFTIKKIREGSSGGELIRAGDYIKLEWHWHKEGGHRISDWDGLHAAIEDGPGRGDVWQVIVP